MASTAPTTYLPDSKSRRQKWVDVSRGVGIILVVYGHILRAHFTSNAPAWVTAQAGLIYAFHMPLFFILSGQFLWSSVSQDRFLASRWTHLLYPYLLWSFITAALEIALARYVNSPLSYRDALLIPFVPLEQYWFLYVLLVCQLAALVAYPRKRLMLVFAVFGLAFLAMFGGEWIVLRSFVYMPYVVLGIFAKKAFDELSRATPRFQGCTAFISWLIFAALWTSGVQCVTLLLGVSGSLGTMALAMLASESKTFAAIGRASFAIYLLHTIFSAGTRIALRWIGSSPTSVTSITFSLAGGIILPYALWAYAKRRNRTGVLGLGAS